MKTNHISGGFWAKLGMILSIGFVLITYSDCQSDVIVIAPNPAVTAFYPVHSRALQDAANRIFNNRLMEGGAAFVSNGGGVTQWYVGKQRTFGPRYTSPPTSPSATIRSIPIYLILFTMVPL